MSSKQIVRTRMFEDSKVAKINERKVTILIQIVYRMEMVICLSILSNARIISTSF